MPFPTRSGNADVPGRGLRTQASMLDSPGKGLRTRATMLDSPTACGGGGVRRDDLDTFFIKVQVSGVGEKLAPKSSRLCGGNVSWLLPAPPMLTII